MLRGGTARMLRGGAARMLTGGAVRMLRGGAARMLGGGAARMLTRGAARMLMKVSATLRRGVLVRNLQRRGKEARKTEAAQEQSITRTEQHSELWEGKVN